MLVMYCRYCGNVVGETQKFCKQCGRQQPLESSEKKPASGSLTLTWIKNGLLITEIVYWFSSLILFGLVLWGFGTNNKLLLFSTLLPGIIISLGKRLLQKQIRKKESSDTQPVEQKDLQLMSMPNQPLSVIEDETKRFDTDEVVLTK